MAQVASLSSLGVDAIAPRRGEILLIEDRNDVREGIAQLLELHGFMVTEVSDGEQGMRELLTQLHGFALVVLDLLLPGPLSGVEFRACQLSDPQLARIPTIIITASDVDSAERRRLHPDGWLDKPFRFDSLLELVKRHVVPEAPGI